MNWNYILYKKEELYDGNAIPLEFAELFCKAEEKNICIVSCDNENFLEKMTRLSILPEEALAIVATDASIEEVKGVFLATVAFKSVKFPEEGLFAADALVEDISAIDIGYLEKIYQRKHGIPWEIARTKRCYLREMMVEDVPALCKLYAGEGMTDFMEPLGCVEEEIEKAEAYIRNMYGFYGYGMWLVFDRERDSLIGRAGLNLSEYKGETILELGYAIDVNYQGCGLATEVCEAVISYAITEEVGFDELHCFIHPKNAVSIRVAEKLGFSFREESISNDKNLYVFSKKLFTNPIF